MEPNIMLASDLTYNRINMIANKENVKDKEGQAPHKYEYAKLGSFVYEDTKELLFYVDNNLPEMVFSLIFDSDPDDDGEPVLEEDTFIQYQKVVNK